MPSLPAGVAVSVLLVMGFASAAFAGPGTSCGKAKRSHESALLSASQGGKAFLGVKMQELDDEIRLGLDVKVKNGVLVSEVIEDSPAAKAGIEEGDIIVEFNGRRVDSPAELSELVGKSDIGDAVEVKVVRDGDSKTCTVTVGEWPEKESLEAWAPEPFMWLGDGREWLAKSFGRGRLGVHAADLNEDLAPYFGVKEGEGVLVVDVIEGSTAEKIGIKAGDVIVRVNDEEVGSVEDLTGAMRELEGGEKFDVALIRSKQNMTVQGEAKEAPEDLHVKALRRVHKDHVPSVEKFEFEGVPQVQMEKLKEEMKELKEELKELKKELDKVKKST